MKVIIYDGKNHVDCYSLNHEPIFNRVHRVGKPVCSFKEFITVFRATLHPRVRIISNKKYQEA